MRRLPEEQLDGHVLGAVLDVVEDGEPGHQEGGDQSGSEHGFLTHPDK